MKSKNINGVNTRMERLWCKVNKSAKFLGIYSFASILLRLLPHAPNMAPVGALALFAGAHGTSRWSILLPVAVMAISDMFIGFYEWRILIAVYGSFLGVALLGRAIKKNISPEKIMLATFAGSAFFFLVTNTAVWAFSPWYAKSAAGLLESLMMGLPFWRNSLIGDLFYGAIFFGAYALRDCIFKRDIISLTSRVIQIKNI